MSINKAQVFGPVRAGLPGSMDRVILNISTRVGSDPGGGDHQLKGGAGVTEPIGFGHTPWPSRLCSLCLPAQFSMISDLTPERKDLRTKNVDAHLHEFEDDLRHILASFCLDSSDALTDLEFDYSTAPDCVTQGQQGREMTLVFRTERKRGTLQVQDLRDHPKPARTLSNGWDGRCGRSKRPPASVAKPPAPT